MSYVLCSCLGSDPATNVKSIADDISEMWVFGSLLSNIFIDDFTARLYKYCVRILKGSYIVMKCSEKRFDIYP